MTDAELVWAVAVRALAVFGLAIGVLHLTGVAS